MESRQREQDFYKKWLSKLPNSPTLKKGDFINITITFLSLTAAIIAIVTNIILFFQSEKTPIFFYFLELCIWILIVSAILFWYCYKRTLFCERISSLKFASIMDYTHFVNHIIRDHIAKAYRYDENTPKLCETLELVVTLVAECFSTITGHRCRCCIKYVVKKEKENDGKKTDVVYVETACRDNTTINLNKYSQTTIHELKDNTDFVSIFINGQRFYCCGNLQQEYDNHKYKNSTTDWHTFYQSTIVVPIQADFLQPSGDCRGFLCLDSQNKNVFNDPCFVELAGSFADILYSLLIIVEKLEKTTNISTNTIPNPPKKNFLTKN